MQLAEMYDVIIIGGGPAGLAAGIYATRAMLKTKLLEKEVIGGQASITDAIENYPGFTEGISGFELTEKMRQQAQNFGCEITMAEVTEVDLKGKIKTIKTADNSYEARGVIIASGVRPSKLDVPGASNYTGRGISYCATCDGPFFRNRDVLVIGGGNSAVEEAIFLTRFANSVTIVHRRDQLKADKLVQDRAFKNEKIHFFWNSVLTGVAGDETLKKASVKNLETDVETTVDIGGIFVFVGNLPNTEPFVGSLELDDKGYIMTDDTLMTTVQGVYAAGDVRKNLLKQVVWAAAEGALSAVSLERYLETQK